MEQDIKTILNGLRHISKQIDGLQKGKEAAEPCVDTWEYRSESIANLNEAWSIAQTSLEIPKSDSSSHRSVFLSFQGIVDHIRQEFGINGLSFTQEVDEINGRPILITTLRHKSGEFTRSKALLMYPSRDELAPGKDFNQEMGSHLSYMRRYALLSLLGLKPDRDE